MKTRFIAMPLAALAALSGCTAEQVYGSGQAWQRNECNKLPDKSDYDRCMSKTDTTYDSYKRQTEPAQK